MAMRPETPLQVWLEEAATLEGLASISTTNVNEVEDIIGNYRRIVFYYVVRN